MVYITLIELNSTDLSLYKSFSLTGDTYRSILPFMDHIIQSLMHWLQTWLDHVGFIINLMHSRLLFPFDLASLSCLILLTLTNGVDFGRLSNDHYLWPTWSDSRGKKRRDGYGFQNDENRSSKRTTLWKQRRRRRRRRRGATPPSRNHHGHTFQTTHPFSLAVHSCFQGMAKYDSATLFLPACNTIEPWRTSINPLASCSAKKIQARVQISIWSKEEGRPS